MKARILPLSSRVTLLLRRAVILGSSTMLLSGQLITVADAQQPAAPPPAQVAPAQVAPATQPAQPAQSQVMTTTAPAADATLTDPKIPADQLDSLVAPIALYPDPLLANTLGSSTYPIEIVQLQQWLEKNKTLKDK